MGIIYTILEPRLKITTETINNKYLKCVSYAIHFIQLSHAQCEWKIKSLSGTAYF